MNRCPHKAEKQRKRESSVGKPEALREGVRGIRGNGREPEGPSGPWDAQHGEQGLLSDPEALQDPSAEHPEIPGRICDEGRYL